MNEVTTKKTSYTVRWAQAGMPSRANVTVLAVSDYHAKIQADKIGKQLGVSSLPRTIYHNGRQVE